MHFELKGSNYKDMSCIFMKAVSSHCFLVILNAAAFSDLCCLMKICLAEKRRFVECESVGS